MKQDDTDSAPYGYCPRCGERGQSRERRPNGVDRCASGHTYPSGDSVPFPGLEKWRPTPSLREKELEECLRWYVENDETNEGGKWDEINEIWIAGKRRAQRILGMEIK